MNTSSIVELRDRILVKIRVQFELAAGRDLVDAAIGERRVGNEPLDAGNLLQNIDEGAGMDRVEIELSGMP